MVITNLKIVTLDKVIENGFIEIENSKIKNIGIGNYSGNDLDIVDGMKKIAMPGFIDIHIHGSCGIDFMSANEKEIATIANALYKEGTTTFLATTLTSDFESLKNVCKVVAKAKDSVLSLGGIHFEGPYINAKYKGAQNEKYIRMPNIKEFNELVKISNNNVRYISLAPELPGAMEFIENAKRQNVSVSAGHTDASFEDVKKAIEYGLTNTTHTHNAMSGHHHRNPGVVTAAMYFDTLYTEAICDGIHVCPNTLKTFYKIVGPDRFIIVTDALLAKHSSLNEFKIFGLDCIRKDGAAYLTTGPLAGSLLTMEQAIKNMCQYTNASLIELAKISSTNAAKSLNMNDRGILANDKLADIVLLSPELDVLDVYKLGKKVV